MAETKLFREDVFKRRYRAKSVVTNDSSYLLSETDVDPACHV
jgi:hypothetical protein